jgi:uncharacterized membrane protein
MSVGLLKTLHLLGVVLFLGNIIVTAFWKVMADRTRDLAVIRFAVRATNWADVFFTFGGVALLAVAGRALATQGGMPDLPWLRLAYGLFAATGLLWLGVLIPLQRAQAKLLAPLPHDAAIPARYWHLALAWAVAGTLATLLPLGIVWLMTVKPSL